MKSGANELEVAATIATAFEQQDSASKDLRKAQQMALASRPSCSGYINSVTHFVKQFAGGEQFPLLKLLQSISVLEAL